MHVSRFISIGFIKEHLIYIDWSNISIKRNLSTEFIRKFIDKLDWECITRYIDLNKSFIQEFYDKLDLKILKQRNLIEEFMSDTEFELLEVMGKLI